MDELKKILANLSDDELTEAKRLVAQEAQDRRSKPAVEAGKAEVIAELREQGVIKKPAVATEAPADEAGVKKVPAWKNPGVDHAKMYLFGDVVSHNGRVWRSEVQGLNSWEPGADGVWGNIWADVTPQAEETEQDNTAPVWKERAKYAAGDRVAYDGSVYQVIQAHTSQADWLPNKVPSLYKKVGE